MITLVQQWLEEAARLHPDKPAVCCEDESLTFAELESSSSDLAGALRSHGLRRGSFVPFFMKKGVRSIQSILGILKADCAYVPLDSNTPAQRLASILGSLQASVVIVDAESRARFESLVPVGQRPDLVDVSDLGASDDPVLGCQNLSIDIAYVLFTSGSTGTPKGVMIPHKAIIDYIDWCVDIYELTSDDVISNHAPLYFDNSTFDIYTALKTGATLHLVHEELNAVIPRLVSWLAEREITTFFCVPSVMTMLLRSRRLKPGRFPRLRHVIAAGEVLAPDVVDAWMEVYPEIQFTNMYGPTEITVDCSYHVIRERPGSDAVIPIGRARRNMELFVRTESGELRQDVGAQGELLVRGTSVAYGYLGDAERTSKVFIQNPNNAFFHDPLYCTGDLVRIDDTGDLIFLGREDHQIKFLGYRIELGEIEASLVALDQVEEGVVVFRSAAPQEIGALVTLAEGCDAKQVTEALKQRLPAYMQPTTVKSAEGEFPRTSNGKYDRRAIVELVFG